LAIGVKEYSTLGGTSSILFFSDYKDTTFYRETVIFTLLFWGGKL
jgi:hypothetical protein